MASTPTTRNRFRKQGTGDNAGTWGDRLNEDDIELIDESNDGVVTVAVNGPVTLSSVNYGSDEARNRVLKFSGVGGTVTIPGVQKWYFVHNACLGDVVIKTAAATGVTIAAGAVTPMYCDGADCVIASNMWPFIAGTPSAPSIYFAGDPDTGIFQPEANSIAVAAGGDTVLTVAPAAVAIDGTLAATDRISTSYAGTAAAPSIYFPANPTTGFYSSGAAELGISAGGSKIAAISSTGLSLSGALTLPAGTAAPTPAICFTGDRNTGLFSASPDTMGLACAGTQIVRVATTGVTVTGDVGLSGVLSVPVGTPTTPAISFAGDTNTGIFSAGPETLMVATAGAQIVGVSPAGVSITGTVGVSGDITTSAVKGTPLQIGISNTSALGGVQFYAGNGASTIIVGKKPTAAAANGALTANCGFVYSEAADLSIVADSTDGTLKFAAGGTTETARCWRTLNGPAFWRFGLSSWNFYAGPAAVSIAYDGPSQSGIVLRPQTDGSAALVFSNAAGVSVGTISQTSSQVVYGSSSDYRLKENVADLSGSGQFVDGLRPRQWTWRGTGERGAGFVAHEAQTVAPASVTGDKDAVDAAGKPVYQAMMAGSPEIIANLVAEVQALRARVAALEAR